MNATELLQALWRRKLIIVGVALLAVGLAVAALQLVTPQYESSSTLVVRPSAPGEETDLGFLFTIDAIVPIYASAATSRTTKSLARERTDGGFADLRVETFDGTPLIELKARHEDPEVAQGTAQAVADALIEQVESGAVGIEGLMLTQLERPERPTEPVFPQTALTLAVALVLGLGFGAGAALLRETLTSRIETAKEMGEIAGAPVFGEIQTERDVEKLRSAESLVSEPRYRGLRESMRDLRTNLQFSEEGSRSILITSPEGRHGKTTVAFGLAVTLARAGGRTVLVDGDLRRGRIAEMLRLPRAPGLTEALMGLELEAVIQGTDVEMLDVLTGGHLVEDPAELLVTRFPAVLRQLEEMYEAVVVDSTPLAPVNDARVMASYVESTLIVASASVTRRRELRSAVDRLALISVRPTAVVLNNSRTPRGDYYYAAPA
jgi:capsular exopolysaccharide synthesis family protein